MSLKDKIVALPEKYPVWFKYSALSTVRSFAVFLLSFVLFFSILTLPELLWDSRKNHDFYKRSIENLKKEFLPYTQEPANIETSIRKKWFSPRMWDYRFLVYTVHVNKKFQNPTDHDRELALWQIEAFDKHPSKIMLHYLYNPGFYWDIGFLMPLSLAILVVALYHMIMHLHNYKERTTEGRKPYIPEVISRQLIGFLTDPYTLLSCLLAGLIITAGNHGTGFFAVMDPKNNGTLYITFWILQWISYLAIFPILFIICYGSSQIYKAASNAAFNASTAHTNRIRTALGRLKIIFWISFICTVIGLISLLYSQQGWEEEITRVTLSPIKPLQRIIRYFFLTFGTYASLWIALLIIARSKVSIAIAAMSNNRIDNIEDRIGVFNDLVINEIYVLEYFGIFITVTIMSYLQSAVFIFENADLQTSVGVLVLTGLILIFLTMLIIPSIYFWYVIMDSRRFDKWASQIIASETLLEREEEILNRRLRSRLKDVLKIIFFRYKVLTPLFTLILTLFFAGGLSGLISFFFSKL